MSSTDEISWIKKFCNYKGNEFFCEVADDYIEDRFNLSGLHELVPQYHEALEMVLSKDTKNEVDDDDEDYHKLSSIDRAAELLYGLVHARYILTDGGLERMQEKYLNNHFGYCRRVFCDNQAMLPIGLSDLMRERTVKAYCPKCRDVYNPSIKCRGIDGAYFGTGFPHMFFMAFPGLRPKEPDKEYTPKLYGFKIHPRAYQLQYRAASVAHGESAKEYDPQPGSTIKKSRSPKPRPHSDQKMSAGSPTKRVEV